ncbi:unnamed protein product [Mytilus edulis]|uniref:THAP-type domain-containing protein n=1 Tax=Mytilus edulis TaxID=6550 RepID=A0A8S3S5R2_MYTED|nr:unnamed protein product [Mytilus edulis]
MPRGDRGGSSRGSGTRCVAANCGNTNADGFSLHSFPKDPNLRKKWTGFVKPERANCYGPTESPEEGEVECAVPTVHSHSIAKQVSMVKEKPIETEQPIPTTLKHALPRLEMLSRVVEYEVDDPKPTTATFSCQVNKKQKRDLSKARLIQRPRSIRTLQRK